MKVFSEECPLPICGPPSQVAARWQGADQTYMSAFPFEIPKCSLRADWEIRYQETQPGHLFPRVIPSFVLNWVWDE